MAKELYLYNPIYSFVAESIISQLEENMGNEIVLRTNSQGGEVKAGYGIASKISEHGNVTMKVDGSADSMAANLLMYAKSVECLDVSTFTLHRAAYPSWYTPSEEENASLTAINKGLKSKMLAKIDPDVFKEVTGKTIDDMFDPEQRINIELNAKQAKKIGLVQKINKLDPAQFEAFNRVLAVAHKEEETNNPIKMTIDEIKLKHPEAYNAIVAVGIAKEKDRVGAWMAFVDIDAALVVKGIKDSTELNATAMAELTRKGISANALNKLSEDSAAVVATGEDNAVAKTAKEKELADFNKSVQAQLGIKAVV